MPEVQQVILFGSYAAGRRDLFTDLDVIVMAERAWRAILCFFCVSWAIPLRRFPAPSGTHRRRSGRIDERPPG